MARKFSKRYVVISNRKNFLFISIVKAIQEPLKTNLNRRDHLENFLTSTPRHHYEHGQSIGKNQRQQQSIYPKYKSKPTGFIMQNKT